MEIKTKDGVVEVFGVFWEDKKTYFLGYFHKYKVLVKYRKEEVKVLSNDLGVDFMFHKNGLYYRPLIEKGLLEGLLFGEKEANENFLQALKYR